MLRSSVLLAAATLHKSGVLEEVSGEYILRTPVGAEWAADFEMHRRELELDEAWLGGARQAELRTAVDSALKGIQPTQGESHQSRRFRIYFGEDEPRGADDEIPVWVRDGWNTGREVGHRAGSGDGGHGSNGARVPGQGPMPTRSAPR